MNVTRINELLGDAKNSMPWALIQRQQPRPACLGTRWTRVITPPSLLATLSLFRRGLSKDKLTTPKKAKSNGATLQENHRGTAQL